MFCRCGATNSHTDPDPSAIRPSHFYRLGINSELGTAVSEKAKADELSA